MSSPGRERRNEPEVERIDEETEQRELEATGWERIVRPGKVVWRNPESGFLYPQGVAITPARRNSNPGEVPKKPEGGA